MRRGDIVLTELGKPVGHEQAHRRPVLVISAQEWLDNNPPVVTVVPLTSTYRQQIMHVEIEPGMSGLSVTSYAKCEDIRAVSPERLVRRFGQADEFTMMRIRQVLQRLLAF